MSHKRPTKRSRTSTAEYSSHLSPSSESFQPKRSKLNDEGSVRRSSRAPKPKVFDDEFIDSLHSSLDDNEKKEKPLSPTMDISFDAQTHGRSSNIFDSDSSTRRKSARAPKPKSFDEHFVDSSISKHDFRTPSKEFIPKSPEGSNTFGRTSAKHKSKGKEEKQERSNSKNSVGQGLDYDDFTMVKPPKGNQKGKKSSEKPSYYETYLQQAAHGQYFTQPYTSSYNVVDNVNINDSPKVRQSSRTPKPKKMFSLIEDSTYVSSANDNNDEGDTLICNISNESATTKSGSKSSKKYSHRQSLAEALDVPLEHSKKKAKGKNESSSDEKHSKKSKKSKTDSDLLWNPAFSTKAVYDVMGEHSESKKDSKGRKEKVRSSSSKEVKEDTSAVDVNVKSMSGENCQAKKKLKKKSELKDKELSSSPFFEKTHSKPSAVEHDKKSHPKHSKTKHDEPHSETKDKDQHIILKVHLPQSPSHHLHSHKKHHKHKHHSSESKEGSSSETKTKKPRLSMDGSLSVSSDDTPKKKLSIKFKGLSSSEPDVEVDVESPFSSPSLEKAAANPEKKKKVKKQSQDSVMAPTIPMEDNTQQHVKVVIKKKNEMEKKVSEKSENKQVKSKAKESKLVSSKTPTKEKESKVADPKSQKSHHKVTVAGSIAKAKSVVHGSGGKVKVSEVKPEEKKKSAVPAAKSKTSSSEERPKSSPKKKSKGGGTPGKSPEKKKSNISGYILFCKSERHNIAEANPGLDFPQVSQKVGEAWNSLSDVQKQKWKDKANAIKAKLNLNVEKKDKNQESSSPDVVDMAAHLKLLGESLVLIGTSLKAQRGAEVHGSLSVLLDSILCAICPLTFLTSHIPGIPGVSKEKQIDILDDLAYTMPGLG